jgi:hypothetical protein
LAHQAQIAARALYDDEFDRSGVIPNKLGRVDRRSKTNFGNKDGNLLLRDISNDVLA